MTAACELDHLVLGAHTLEQGAAFIESLLGVQPQPGGAHVAMGTHNLLLRLGARAYLEIIAIDPAGEKPQRPRWFGLDDERTRQQLRDAPRLLTWAVRTQDIDAAAQNCPVSPGTIHPMTRGAYAWRITIPDDGALVCDGLMPTLIQWDCATHPADNLEDRGCELVTIEGTHPSPARIAPALRLLGVDTSIELRTSAPTLAVRIRGPHGICTITS
jgi:hypothetical protein